MGTSALKTTSISNLDATPIVRANPWVHGGNSKQFSGTVEAVTADDTSSTYRFFRIGSWMRPVSLTLFCDALGGSSAVDVGLYRTAADGGAVVNASLFASAVSLVSAITAGSNVRFEQDDIANAEKRIWELLGLSADPNLEYDVTAKVQTTINTGGTVTLHGNFSW